MRIILILLLLSIANICHAEECFDYKKDSWRLGKELCGTSCYKCDSEEEAQSGLLSEYKKYFGDKKPSEVVKDMSMNKDCKC